MGGGGDNWSYKSCKAAVKSSPPTNQHTVFLHAGCPSCCQTDSVRALKGKYHIPWTCLPQAHLGGLPTLSLTTKSSWLLGAGCHASHQPSYASRLLQGGQDRRVENRGRRQRAGWDSWEGGASPPTAQRFSTIFSTQDGLSSHYIILLILDYHAAIGGRQDPSARLAYPLSNASILVYGTAISVDRFTRIISQPN